MRTAILIVWVGVAVYCVVLVVTGIQDQRHRRIEARRQNPEIEAKVPGERLCKHVDIRFSQGYQNPDGSWLFGDHYQCQECGRIEEKIPE